MDTKKLFKKILKRIRTGELIIQSVDELKMIGVDTDGKQEGPADFIHLEIKLTVIPKVKHEN